jgi:hypothetical protein
MKKELLVATALVTSMGMAASVAEAATATFSGKNRVGVKGSDSDSANATYASHQQSTFSVSISETTDSGIKISTGFDLTDESDAASDASGLTLTFTDGSKIDLIEAGNAYSTHLASVPSASGEQGLTGSSTNSAPSSLTYANFSDTVGFEWHSAADAFGVEGLKAGLSASFDDSGSNSATTSVVESAYSIGVNYVTTQGDTTVTIGGGIVSAADYNTSSAKDKANGAAVAITAATGDLTVGLGYAAGDYVHSNSSSASTATADAQDVDNASAVTAGAKYVSGDMTFAIGMASGEGNDGTLGSVSSGSPDTYDSLGASVDYVIISGVTATLGYSDTEEKANAVATTASSGTSWYIGANISF